MAREKKQFKVLHHDYTELPAVGVTTTHYEGFFQVMDSGVLFIKSHTPERKNVYYGVGAWIEIVDENPPAPRSGSGRAEVPA